MIDNISTTPQLEQVDNPDLISTNFYWTIEEGGELFNLQTTIRATLSPGQLAGHLETVRAGITLVLGHGGKAKQVGRGANIAPEAVQTAVQEAISTSPHANDTTVSLPALAASRGAKGLFDVEWIEVERKGNKDYFKVGGGKFSKFGVRIWDEELKEVDIDPLKVVAASQSATDSHMPVQKRYRAYYSTNEKGNPQKVVLLEKLN